MKSDSFGEIYDSMSLNYGKLEQIMSDLYQVLQENPDNEFVREILSRLGTVGQNMLFTQRHFTELYCELGLKTNITNNLELKEQTLTKAIDEISTRQR